MDLGLEGRSALVCASTGGLGLASARALAAEGARVAVTGRREEVAREIAGTLPGAIAIQADLREPGSGQALAEAARDALGQIDILVLNGPGPAPGLASELDGPAVIAAADLLVRPHVELVGCLLPAMRERGWGRIVAVGSSGIITPLPRLASSNLGRSALAGYLKTLAAEVARDGVTVNVVVPGRIATDRVAELDRAAADRAGFSVEEVRRASEAGIPAGRYGRPEEFAAAVVFLAGMPAGYITGSSIRCDGGIIANI
ncbi:MAG TPA: SDR family oxidoreductase [Trebonia sp.]|jgi:3-oxoacyl-[acyl-carrier protein] reductase|nr:SDR family oxidoreductase [Trebonia sp.]